MKSFNIHFVIAIMLLSLPLMGCFAPMAEAQLPDSWVNLGITSFNGDNISFTLQITVQGNHLADLIWILQQSESDPSSSVGFSSGVSIQVWRAIDKRIYSQDTNTTVFSTDFTYSTRSPYYKAGPKFLNLLLFPADSNSLIIYLESSFNITVDTHPAACQVPSQNYQGSFNVIQTSSDAFTVNVLINHSESFFWGVSGVLITTLVSLYGLTTYLGVLIYRKKSSSSSNIVTVSSAIIFFVPAFEIAFYSLKSPLPLVFSDIFMIALIPFNALVIGFALGMSVTGVIIKLRSKFSELKHAIQKARTKPQTQKS